MNEAIIISEVQIISAMENMCVQSLDPETFEMWCEVKNVLRITRKALGDKTAEMQLCATVLDVYAPGCVPRKYIHRRPTSNITGVRRASALMAKLGLLRRMANDFGTTA